MSTFFQPPHRGVQYAGHIDGVGDFAARPLDVEADIALVHDWVTRDYARYWLMADKSLDEVTSAYQEMVDSAHSQPFMGLFDGERSFLVETYHPAHDEVGEHYRPRSGDRGMHVLVGPAERPIPGFTKAVFQTVMELMFSDPAVERVVVEPDARNEKIHALNRRFGFVYERDIEMRAKRASLAFCTREDFRASVDAKVSA